MSVVSFFLDGNKLDLKFYNHENHLKRFNLHYISTEQYYHLSL